MVAASSATGRAPAKRPRSGASPKPRWSGANTAMPAAAKSGAGISQASRLSFMPCSASITAQGGHRGLVRRAATRRYGRRAPSGHGEHAVHGGRGIATAGTTAPAAQRRLPASAQPATASGQPCQSQHAARLKAGAADAIIRPPLPPSTATIRDDHAGRHQLACRLRGHPRRRPHRRLRWRRRAARPSARVPAHRRQGRSSAHTARASMC